MSKLRMEFCGRRSYCAAFTEFLLQITEEGKDIQVFRFAFEIS